MFAEINFYEKHRTKIILIIKHSETKRVYPSLFMFCACFINKYIDIMTLINVNPFEKLLLFKL